MYIQVVCDKRAIGIKVLVSLIKYCMYPFYHNSKVCQWAVMWYITMYAFRCFNKHQEKFFMKEMEKLTENIR